LDSRSSDEVTGRLRAFRQGLKETGYIEGENVAIVYRFADNQIDRLAELADDLAHRQVAVIVTASGPSALPSREWAEVGGMIRSAHTCRTDAGRCRGFPVLWGMIQGYRQGCRSADLAAAASAAVGY